MKRTLTLLKNKIEIQSCKVTLETKKEEFKLERKVAVDITNSKCIDNYSNDNGIIVFNEDLYGYYLDWKEYEKLKSKKKIKEEDEDQFMDDITTDIVDTVINHINTEKKSTSN